MSTCPGCHGAGRATGSPNFGECMECGGTGEVADRGLDPYENDTTKPKPSKVDDPVTVRMVSAVIADAFPQFFVSRKLVRDVILAVEGKR